MTSMMNQTFQGFYKIATVDGITDEVKWESDWNKNLILNQGMDAINSQYIANLTKYAVVGTGHRVNNISSGDSKISQSGATITLLPIPITGLEDFTSSYLNYPLGSAEVGDYILYSLTESRITAVNGDGQHLTVTPSYTFSDSRSFIIWKTSQEGLNNEVKRAGGSITGTSYLTGAGNCGSTRVSNVYTHRRTYDFTTESVDTPYSEIGVSWDSSSPGPTTVFSRIVLPSDVIISSSYKLRVIYDLQVAFTPTSSVYKTPSVTGWTSTSGTESIQNMVTSTIQTTGLTTGIGVDQGVSLDPIATSTNCTFFGSSNSQSLATFPSASSRSSDVAFALSAKSVYTSMDFFTDKSATFTTGQLNINRIRTIGFGHSTNASDTTNQAFCFRFDTEQTKSNTQTLTLTYRTTWGRTLS